MSAHWFARWSQHLRRRFQSATCVPMLSEQTLLFQNREEWLAFQSDQSAEFGAQRKKIAELAQWPQPSYAAVCGLCREQVVLPMPWVSEGKRPNLREAMVCPCCHLNARMRTALGLMQAHSPKQDSRIYFTEQATLAFVWLRQQYRNACGSEFNLEPARRHACENWLSTQGVHDSIANEDITALSFAYASLDAIGSFDVLEHVPDYQRALSEFARCLKPGGHLLLTAPFLADNELTLVRARVMADGSIDYLLPAEIHGDPISGGVLCYYHFGWDLLAAARSAGFSKAAWCRTWSAEQGLFGLWTLHARR